MTPARLKRIVVSLVGFTVLILGIILIVFPGPAFIVIPIGPAILATEYVWAKNLLEKMKIGTKKRSAKKRIGNHKFLLSRTQEKTCLKRS